MMKRPTKDCSLVGLIHHIYMSLLDKRYATLDKVRKALTLEHAV